MAQNRDLRIWTSKKTLSFRTKNVSQDDLCYLKNPSLSLQLVYKLLL